MTTIPKERWAEIIPGPNTIWWVGGASGAWCNGADQDAKIFFSVRPVGDTLWRLAVVEDLLPETVPNVIMDVPRHYTLVPQPRVVEWRHREGMRVEFVEEGD